MGKVRSSAYALPITEPLRKIAKNPIRFFSSVNNFFTPSPLPDNFNRI